jgi:hypothetical protein
VTDTEPDDPTEPGPFSFGEPDRIRAVLRAAAFSDITIEPVGVPLWMGDDVADAVTFLKSTRMGKALLGDGDPQMAARVSEAVATALEPYVTPAGVLLGSRAWIVTATRPSR